MVNRQLINILKQYPEDCEIFIECNSNYESPNLISVDFEEDNDFENPQLIIHI